MTDGSIGFISSEGEVGRIAENLEELLTFLIHAGNIFDFNCKHLYQNPSILTKYCDGYISTTRKNYKAENKDWDRIRSDIAKELSLPFDPKKLADLAMVFIKQLQGIHRFLVNTLMVKMSIFAIQYFQTLWVYG